jgi:AraC-like DNA-binding protein
MISRNEEIFQNFLILIDEHLKDIVEGKTDVMYELRDFAKRLFIHPGHFSNVIKEHTGKHPCYYFEKKILVIAKDLLRDTQYAVADVAQILTYDPSNFTKWFKAFEGMTPSQYRAQLIRQHQQTTSPVMQE